MSEAIQRLEAPRSVQATATNYAPQSEVPKPPKGLTQAHDAIYDTSPEESHVPMRPTLPRVIETLYEFEHNATESTRSSKTRLINNNKNLARLQREVTERINERKNKQGEVTAWRFLQDVATCISSAAGMMVGTSLIASANPINVLSGGALFFGGLSSITSLGLKNYFDQNYDTVAGAVALVGGALSLLGTGVLFTGTHKQDTIPTLVSASLALLNGASLVGKSMTDANLDAIDGDLAKLRKRQAHHRQEASAGRRDIQETTERLKQVTETTRAILDMQKEATITILRG